MEDGGNLLHQFLPLWAGGYVADGARDSETRSLPFAEAAVELRCIARTCVNWGSECCEFLDNGVPVHIQHSQRKYSKQLECLLTFHSQRKYNKQLECSEMECCRKWWEESDPIPLVPPVTSAVVPCRDHLLLLSDSAIFTLNACVFLLLGLGFRRFGGLAFMTLNVVVIANGWDFGVLASHLGSRISKPHSLQPACISEDFCPVYLCEFQISCLVTQNLMFLIIYFLALRLELVSDLYN